MCNWTHILGHVLGEARVWTRREEDVRQGWQAQVAHADAATRHIRLERMQK